MRIEEHPFHVLGITARSSRREILERAEALSAKAGSEGIGACRVQVTHPAKRLDAEVSWFPGISPAKLCRLIGAIVEESTQPEALEEQFYGVDSVGKFNALGYYVAARKSVNWTALQLLIDQLTRNLQSVDSPVLIAILNADRSLAGLPEVTDVAAVENAVKRRGESVAASLAERFSQASNLYGGLLTQLVLRDTDGGKSPVSDFMGHLVDRYQVEAQPSLSKLHDTIIARCGRVLSVAQLQSTPGARMAAAIAELEQKVAEWGRIAEPIRLLKKLRGLRDTPSIEVAGEVRSTAVTLANEFGLHAEAQRLTKSLRGVFGAIAELSELLEEDLETLEGLIREKELRIKCEEERRAKLKLREEEKRAAVELSGLQAEHARGAAVGTGITPPDQRLIDPGATPLQGVQAGSLNGGQGVDAFVRLCRSITATHWKRTLAGGGRSEDLAILKAACGDYRHHVPPWLAILCSTHSGDTEALRQVRNAAAECLTTLSHRFSIVDDFETAQRLALEALSLVLSNDDLEAQIHRQLEETAGARAARSALGSVPAVGTQRLGDGDGSLAKGVSADQRMRASSLLGWCVGIAIFLGVLVLFVLFPVPEGNPPRGDPGTSNTVSSPLHPPGGFVNLRPEDVDKSSAAAAQPQVSRETTTAVSPKADFSDAAKTARGDIFDQAAVKTGLTDTPTRGTAVYAAIAVSQQPFLLANGTDLIPPQRYAGLGKLNISNYGDTDAAVKLKTSGVKATVRFFYVRAMSDVSISKISSGDYILQFATGKDWDVNNLNFRRDVGFAALEKVLSFSERQVPDGIIYSTHRVTLHEVPNGNVHRISITPSEFADDWGIGQR
jgi:hypothetical protein